MACLPLDELDKVRLTQKQEASYGHTDYTMQSGRTNAIAHCSWERIHLLDSWVDCLYKPMKEGATK